MQYAPFTNAESESARIGHIIGITGQAKIKESPNLNTVYHNTEGNYTNITIQYVVEKINGYKPLKHQDEWDKIRRMFLESKSDVECAVKYHQQAMMLCDAQLDRYKQNNPLLVCSGWLGHSISIVFYKGYMIVSNRGSGGTLNQGSIIYQLNKNLTAQDIFDIQNISYESFSPKSQYQIEAKLTTLAGEKIAAFPQHSQTKGTCSYVNKIAATEGILCLLSLEKEGRLNDNAIREHVAENDRSAYKDFTRACRASECERVIHLIQQALDTLENDQVLNKYEARSQLSVMINIAFTMIKKMARYNAGKQKRVDEYSQACTLLDLVQKHTNLLSRGNQAELPTLEMRLEEMGADIHHLRGAEVQYLPLNLMQRRVSAQPSIKMNAEELESFIIEISDSLLNKEDLLKPINPFYSRLINNIRKSDFDEINKILGDALKLYPNDANLKQAHNILLNKKVSKIIDNSESLFQGMDSPKTDIAGSIESSSIKNKNIVKP